MAQSFTRRMLLGTGISGAALMSLGGLPALHAKSDKKFKIQRSAAEWKKRLGPARYHILREEGTEAPFTSPLDREKRQGVFACAGCNLGVYRSATKFDSGTGWPSFFAPIAGRIGTSTDYKLGYPRTEVHCSRCGGHLGHVFDDGPPPTGKRYCMNGLALKFIPA